MARGAVLGLLLWSSTAAAQDPARADLEARLSAGDAAWAREDHPSAFAAYNAVVRADSAYSTRALFRLGTLHAWRGRYRAALACHRLYVRLVPDDLDGQLAIARTLAWSGRYDDALALYASLAGGGATREAAKGEARVLAWRGDLGPAEDRWRRITHDHPDDAEAWTGLGQVLRWRGRFVAAEEALARALALAPDDRDAREQAAWVRADVRPSSSFGIVWARDSERNTLHHLEVSGAMLTRGNHRITGTLRGKQVATGSVGSAVVVPGAHGVVQWQPGEGRWTLRGELGVVQFPAGAGAASGHLRIGGRASGRLGPRLTVGGGAGREPFDDLASTVDRALMLTTADAELGFVVHPQLSLGVAASHGEVSGRALGDKRTTALGAARWTLAPGLQLAVTHREVAWDDPQFGVFFAPQRFALTEGSVRWVRPRDLGLVATAEAGLGAQLVRFEGDPTSSSRAPRVAVQVGWRPRPGREIVAGFVHASVAGAGTVTADDYRYRAATLTGRWTF